MHALYRFRIPHHLGLHETVPYGVLAERCGLTEDDLRRYLRMAMSLRLFQERRDPGTGASMVGHSAASAVFVALPSALDFLGMLTEDMNPASSRLAEALTRFSASQEPSEAAACIAMGTEGRLDYYAAIARDEDTVRRVSAGMSMATQMPSHAVAHFVENCGWDAPKNKRPQEDGEKEEEKKRPVCPTKIVDIGGSEGELCKALLERYPAIAEAVSLDRAEVVEGLVVPDRLRGRLRFGAYDFLEQEQPVTGADVYIFRNCFHNWPDKYAVRMLRNQIPALRRGARVFVNEACLPELDPARLVKGQVAW
jgi:hypothetical protein